MRKPIVLLAVSAAVACPAPHAATAAAKPPALPGPGSFAGRIDNPWFPLTPGTVLVYEGEEDGEPVRDVLKVTHRTKTIEGVRATVIDDRVYLRGRLEERTTDWYAQDKAGNVWYLGEDTATLDANGKVDSTDGTWRAGVDGGRAGIFMPAHPRAGQAGLQEYSKGEAEDAFEILHLAVGVRTPAVSSHHAMLVRETTRLEPGVVDHKIYVRGVGTVLEETVKGGDERLALVSVRRP
jgi:hypothetical protein